MLSLQAPAAFPSCAFLEGHEEKAAFFNCFMPRITVMKMNQCEHVEFN